MKLSNTIQHLTGGVIFAFACLILIINLSVSARVPTGWSLIGFWLCVTIGWEIGRCLKAQKKNFAIKANWPDTIADLLAGNVPVWLLCIIGMYGQSVVGVMR